MDLVNFPFDMMIKACFLLLMLLDNNRVLMNCVQDVEAKMKGYQMKASWLRCSMTTTSSTWTFKHTLLSITSVCGVFTYFGRGFRLLSEASFDDMVFPVSFAQVWRQALDQDVPYLEVNHIPMSISIGSIAVCLSPTICRQATKYHLAVPIVVRLAYTLLKLSHSASFLIVS